MQNRDCFREFIERNFEIDEIISKMLLDGEWGVHADPEVLSELYNVEIQVFDFLESGESITRISTVEGENVVSMLFSWDHYDSLTPTNNEDNFILLFGNKGRRGCIIRQTSSYKTTPF